MKEEVKKLGKSCIQKPMAVLILLSIFNALLLFQYWKTSKDQKYSHPPPKSNQQNNTGFVSQGQYNYKSTVEGDICKFQPSSPQELIEEQNIFSSIAWPQTPPLLGNKSTNARGSSFTLHRGTGGQQWHVGDELRVTITMKDFLGKPKKTGGDVLVARVHNSVLQAGVAGQVIDHENGSYTATFPLLWTGKATIEVTLLHPSEAVTVIRRLNKDNPDRVYFKSVFRLNSISETMNCNFCLRPTNLPVCDFTDLRTGEPWFCFKPKQLGCESRISHSKGGYHKKIFPKPGEEKIFQKGVNMKVKLRSEGPAFVNVLPRWTASSGSERNRTVENLGHSGYYYRGEWQALDGTRVQHFQKPAAMSKCLQGKKIYMFGDSTVRQWYEYLVEKLPGLVNFDFHNGPKTGPYMATDIANNIFMLYQVHGLPIRIRPISVSKVRYVANELNSIEGGANTVVILGIWAHFGSLPEKFYLRRLQRIRNAVVQLLIRSPGTLVIIRTGNIKDLSASRAVFNSDWSTMQQNKILRAVFHGVNVRWVDAWEMTLAHDARFLLHPLPPIIKNMVDVVLSYICPLKVGKVLGGKNAVAVS
ncbi:NXPE family member 3-like [Synchiropus splendidus]|uniref:NXPE family member 3-like n=1 Tax=Synchiropus splendidus TaxID=270530 RepID=UPI00237E6B0F|nr:NXPE family member 3-like [Synchiropus splendidus]